jgi:hypothetical protein
VKVIGCTEFDSMVNKSSAKIDLTERNLSQTEQELFIIRSSALKAIREDSFFKRYEKTNINVVPLISNGEKKVYILTAMDEKNTVIFGNDYVLKYDDANNLVSKKQLHKTLIPSKFGEYNGQQITEGYHTHVIDDLISPTDICTIMLYEKIAQWDEYVVVSKNYFSIWNCKTDELLVLTSEEAKTYFSRKK